MYQSYWGLALAPFRPSDDPRHYYRSPVHEEALARLHFLVEQRRRLGLLIGRPGTGKSLLLEVFTAEIRAGGLPVARVNAFGVDPAEFLWLILAGLGLNPRPGLPMPTLWRLLVDRLAEHRHQRLDTVLLVDDADRASPAILGQLARLARHPTLAASRVVIALSARPDHLGDLGTDLLELADLRIDLEPWEGSETGEYLLAALRRAGREERVFDHSGVSRLHELSEGVPRRVNQLAELALVAGAGRRLDRIDAETIESVCRELGAVEV